MANKKTENHKREYNEPKFLQALFHRLYSSWIVAKAGFWMEGLAIVADPYGMMGSFFLILKMYCKKII